MKRLNRRERPTTAACMPALKAIGKRELLLTFR